MPENERQTRMQEDHRNGYHGRLRPNDCLLCYPNTNADLARAIGPVLKSLYPQNPDVVLGREARAIADAIAPLVPGAEYVRQLEDACLALWGELPAHETRRLRQETPALADFLVHMHHSIEHEQAMVRENVWFAPPVGARNDPTQEAEGDG